MILKGMTGTDKMDYETVYREHIHELFSYGSALGIERELLQDVIHDVFLHLFEQKKTMDNSRNIKVYLFRCLKNRFIDLKRKELPMEEIDQQIELNFTLKVTAIELLEQENEEEKERISQQIEKMLQLLTSRQREAIYLHYMHRLEYDEIAVLLNISTKGVRKLVYRSLSKIRKLYGVEMSLLFLVIAQASHRSHPPM